jgi:tetratricopeptide (TPR) repeat protein
MEATLLAQINAGQVEPAIATMKALEESGSTSGQAQLYFKLGKLLERELERLRTIKDFAAHGKMQQSYRSFLTALTQSKVGQTYESLQWAGESLLPLGAFPEAETVFRRVLSESINSPAFMNQPGAKERVLRTQLKLSAALRGQAIADKKKLAEASSLVEELLSHYSRYIEPLVEKGMLLETQAEAEEKAKEKKAAWSEAFDHWQGLAQKLSRMRPRPLAYYDAWYHAAWSLSQQQQSKKARQMLNGVLRLNPEVGSPEMKAKYQQFIERIK